ncbi:MAG: hypothetical protein ACRENL_05955, partial [Candidatus Dormibacteria bacterium]
PGGASGVDLANPRRVIRAVEVLRRRDQPLAMARRRAGGRGLALVVLDADRDLHRAVLAARLDAMFASGAILAEVRAELDRGTAAASLGRAGIGYREAVAVLEGDLSIEGARASTARRTQRYVKAQRTWFRHEPAVLRLQRTPTATTSALAGEVLAALPTPGGSRR